MARRIVDIATNNGIYASTQIPQSVIDSFGTNILPNYRPLVAEGNIGTLGTLIGGSELGSVTVTSQNEFIKFQNINNGSSGECIIKMGPSGSETDWTVFDTNYSYQPKGFFTCVIDDDNYLGWIVIIQSYVSGGQHYYSFYQYGNENCYNWIKGNEPVLYQWTSVPAISGKNGILLPMSTLNDINDGNEVTTSDTSKFNLNDSSNIKNLVDAVVNDF